MRKLQFKKIEPLSIIKLKQIRKLRYNDLMYLRFMILKGKWENIGHQKCIHDLWMMNLKRES